MKTYLLLPRMQIQNANAMSSTCTIGFPAMTAWLGGVHALERKIRRAEFSKIHFSAVAVACHDFQLRVYGKSKNHRSSIIGMLNPSKLETTAKGENQKLKRPSFIEEAKIHLTVSILIEVNGINALEVDSFLKVLSNCLLISRWAGGDLFHYGKPDLLLIDEADIREERDVLRRLMPGYVIIERRDLMESAMKEGEESLSALLRFLAVQHRARRDENGQVTGWKRTREAPGWIVPIAVGFKGLTPLGHAACQRDPDMPHRFVESILTLGEFQLPCRFHHIEEILWHYEYHDDSALYLCRNQKSEEK